MAISSIGVGSGLPLDQLLSNLRTSESQSLNLISNRLSAEKSRLSAYGTIKSALEGLKTAAATLEKAETFGALKATTGSEAFSATASSSAIAGNYQIQVTQLASAQTLKSATGQASRDTALASGDVTVTVELVDGTTTTISVAADDTSLEGITQAINNTSGVGVQATLVNNGDPANPHYLLLNAEGMGEQAAVKSITVAGVDAGTDVTALNDSLGFTQGDPASALSETAAKNATLTINGIDVTSQTNTLTDAIEGVTLTLIKENTAPESLAIQRDDTVAKDAVNAFVSAYNKLQNSIKSLTSYNTDTQRGSALTGDSLVRRIQSQVREAINVSGSTGTVRNLSQMGITTDPTTGTLKVDNDALTEALKDNLVDVKNLLSGGTALSGRVTTATDVYVKTDGLLSSATESINSNLKVLNQQYDATSDRIDTKMEVYRNQFIQLDKLIAQMNSTSTYLTQQLSALSQLGGQQK